MNMNTSVTIEKFIEPQLDSKFEKDKPNKDCHIPTFIIIKARKK